MGSLFIMSVLIRGRSFRCGEGRQGVAHVLFDEVGIDCDCSGGSFARGGDHLRARVRGVAGCPDPGNARPAAGIDPKKLRPRRPRSRVSRSDRLACVECRSDEDGGTRNGATIRELNGLETIVDDRKPSHQAVDDGDPSRLELRPLGVGDRRRVR
jgi:hypothetical protein